VTTVRSAYPIRQPRPAYRLALSGLVLLEVSATVAYFAATSSSIGQTRYLVYPFVWINVGIAGVLVTRTPAATSRRRLLVAALAVGYFLLLFWLPGNVGLGAGGALDARVAWLAPGWGPLVAVSGPVRAFLVPFEVVGYLALTYLVYANGLAFGRSTLSGSLGLVTCVGCTTPVLVPVLGILGGPTTGLASTAYAWSYDVGTVLFVLTVWLLVRGANVAASDQAA
jgi:hypothetical protein